MIEHAPASFNAAQMRFFLHLLVHLDYSFLEEVANHFANSDENSQSDEEIVLSALDSTADEKLTGLALRLVLSDHLAIPHESQPDLLLEAERVFVPESPTVKKEREKTSSKKTHAIHASAKKGASNRAA